jgi:hypothetical protein
MRGTHGVDERNTFGIEQRSVTPWLSMRYRPPSARWSSALLIFERPRMFRCLASS